MRRIKLLLILSFFSVLVYTQVPEKRFNIVFYNVENLFDTIQGPLASDLEFLPTAEKKWDSDKYFRKTEDIARVLSSIATGELPEIIGLAEIENRKVLEDLISSPSLASGNYGIVHEESPDIRGIDVALLYRKDQFKVINHETIPVIFPFDSSIVTRDILYVRGKTDDNSELHLFVNHWSSRVGGEQKTEALRMYCAVTLRRKIDILLGRISNPKIVVMGDFNDEPTNRSIMGILQASNKRRNITPGDLYNPFYDLHNLENKGSYYYQTSWNMLDQILISHSLINKKGSFSASWDSGRIFSEEWMLFKNQAGIMVPNRTYVGNNYTGGVSDHLPVYIVLER